MVRVSRKAALSLLGLGDIALFNLSTLAVLWLRFDGSIPPSSWRAFAILVPWLTLSLVIGLLVFDQYSARWRRSDELLWSIVLAVAATTVVGMALSFFFRNLAYPRSVFAYSALLQVLSVSAWRVGTEWLARRVVADKPLMVIGAHEDYLEVADRLLAIKGSRYSVKEIRVFDDIQGIAEGSERVNVVCFTSSVPEGSRKAFLARFLEEGKRVFLIPSLYEIVLWNAHVSRMDDLPVLELENLRLAPDQLVVKRVFDIVVSSLALIVATPIFVLIAIAIKLDSRGKILYRQERVGRSRSLFQVVKFRTMVDDAEALTGAILAAERDPRTTRVGRLLRAARIDELPQLWNVLRGEMSLVGPRPERPVFVDEFLGTIQDYQHRFSVKPGITGLAQISGRYHTSADDKLRYDLFYILNYSLLLDLRILMLTLRVVLTPGSATGVPLRNGDRYREVAASRDVGVSAPPAEARTPRAHQTSTELHEHGARRSLM